MYKLAAVFFACALIACASTGTSSTVPVGKLLQAGPTSARGDVLSIKWQYGFQFKIDPNSVSNVKLSCPPIPGTTMVVTGSDLKVPPNGIAIWEGETLSVSKETTPWLFMPTTTSAVCEAVISRIGMDDAIVRAPVNFSVAVKAAALAQLKAAHEHNSKLKKKETVN
jgi:hypothetical protein